MQSRSKGKGKVTSQRHLQHPTRLGLTIYSQPQTSQPKRKSGPPIGPTISWSKVKCFALGLAVAHQWKWRKNGTTVTDWKAVLEVINDVYLQEFDDFRAIYPNGLTLAGKLRSEYSDRERGRHEKWRLRQDQCTPQQIQEILRMRDIVFSTERRLSQVPDSLVVDPRPGAATWVWYQVKPPNIAAPKAAQKAARKSKRKAKEQSESEAEDDGEEEDESFENGDDDNEEEDSEVQDGGEDNAEQERSTHKDAGEEESSSGSDDASESDRDGDIIVVASLTSRPRPIVVSVEDEDEDTERASDEEIGNPAHAIIELRKKAGHAKPAARQTRPQRKNTRLNEVQNVHDDDEQPAESTFLRDAFHDGRYGDFFYDYPTFPFGQSSESLHTLGDPEWLPMSSVRGDGALNNAIIQAKGAAAIGQQGGINITPASQNELLRHYKQGDMQALRYDQAKRFKGLVPPNYPPVQVVQDRILNTPHALDGDGTILPQSYPYRTFRRELIAAFQARRRIDFWAEVERISGQWNVTTDLINPMAMSTGMSRADVINALTIAEKNQVDSSIELGQLLIMPTKIDQYKGEPNGTLENLVQQINRRRNLQMVHTNDVDFATQPPTYTIRKHKNGSRSNFCFVHASDSLYSQTGEVRRVLLTDETTGQGQEVDVMLCDKPLCEGCEPQEDMFERNFDHAEQRRQLPLVHRKDVVMLEDKNLYFVPMQQGPVLKGTSVIKRDIHEVIFGHGFSRAIFCDKARCPACRGASCVPDLVYTSIR